MSKSLGDFRLVLQLLKSYRGVLLRVVILRAQYRSALNFSVRSLEEAKEAMDKYYYALREAEKHIRLTKSPIAITTTKVFKALVDDIDTPSALGEMSKYRDRLNRALRNPKNIDTKEIQNARSMLLAAGELLGLLQENPTNWFQQKSDDGSLSNKQIDTLINERNAAKQARNFSRADEIRDQLKQAGIQLEDTREGTRWTR